MSEMNKSARIGEISSTRTKVRSNPALQIELLAAISATLRNHGVVPDPRVVSELCLALPEEVTQQLDMAVVLPGGTNCAKL